MSNRFFCWIFVVGVCGVALAGCLDPVGDDPDPDSDPPDTSDSTQDDDQGESDKHGEETDADGDAEDGSDDEQEPPRPDVELVLLENDVPVLAGVPTPILVQIVNVGDVEGDLKVLAEGPPSWTLEVDPAGLSLASGEEANVSVEVTAPEDAEVGDSETIEITITDGEGDVLDAGGVDVVVDYPYEQDVWFNWQTLRLNVLVLGVQDPVVGSAIMEGIERWEVGIDQLAPELWEDPSLVEDLEIRVHWPAVDGPPPSDFVPNVLFVPQGFNAITGGFGTVRCIATAPMLAGWGSMAHTAAHEFGHCLGLDHVYDEGVEYEPAFDILGGGESGFVSCPSNLNLQVMERAFTGGSGTVQMATRAYHQADC